MSRSLLIILAATNTATGTAAAGVVPPKWKGFEQIKNGPNYVPAGRDILRL